MRKHWLKTTICLGTMVSIVGTTNPQTVLSSTLCKETELAGMSILLDKYYEEVQLDSLDPEAVVALGEENGGEANVEAPESQTQEQEPAQPEANEAAAIEGEAGAPVEAEAVEPVQEAASRFENVGISKASEYVNVRRSPNTESKIKGKLYRGSAAEIVKTVGDWVKIKSGNVNGYIKSEYLAIGFSAEEMAERYGTKLATVNTTTLKVREERNLDCVVLTLIPMGETYEVIKEYDEWVKIVVDESTKGYVSKEYVDMDVEFKKAISIKEEREKLRRQEEARQAEREAQERLRQQQLQQQQQQQQQSSSSSSQSSSQNNSSSSSSQSSSHNSSSSNHSSNHSSNSNSSSNNSSNSSSNNNSSSSSSSSSSGLGATIVNYATKFVGNPYVMGGTSLTNGADCSGFVQTIYRSHGIPLPRTSSAQSGSGRKISVSEAKAGDLIFYASNGSVGHVAICMGNGKVVHASSRRTGITISNMYYRTPYSARRVIN